MDVIVVGGGIGGLTLGALLAAQNRKKVLVLEAQDQIGGYAREFKGGSGTSFDLGALHMGSMHPGSRLRAVLDQACGRPLLWRSLNFELEKYIFAEEEFSVPAASLEFKQRLKQRFPKDAVAIEEYFASIKKTAAAYILWEMCETFPAWVSAFTKLYLRLRRPQLFRTTAQQLARWFKDDRLKEILSAQWTGYGTSPEKSSFGYHCLHVDHHMAGAWYPEKGLGEVSKALVQRILSAGGEVRTSTSVQQILIRNGVAVGVRLQDGTEILSDLVISNAGAHITYGQLLPTSYVPANLHLSESQTSAVMLCLDLKDSARVIGLTLPNYRIQRHKGLPIFMTLTSLKRADTSHSAQVLVLCDSAIQAKDCVNIRENALRILEESFPGFRSLIRTCEVIDPATFQRWHNGAGKNIFGLPPMVQRRQWRWSQSRTPVRNLFLTGSDVLGPGFGSAVLGALKTFELVQGQRSWTTALRTWREAGLFARGELS